MGWEGGYLEFGGSCKSRFGLEGVDGGGGESGRGKEERMGKRLIMGTDVAAYV